MIRALTYEDGRELPLVYEPQRIVSRAPATRLRERGLKPVQALSAHSLLVEFQGRFDDALQSAREAGAPAFPDYKRADTGERYTVSDRLFVSFHKQLGTSAINVIAKKNKLRLVKRYTPRDYLFQVDEPQLDPTEVAVSLMRREEKSIASVDHDVNQRAKLTMQRDDPGCAVQWHLRDDHAASLQCDKAWSLLGDYGSRDVVIGMIDAGFDIANPEFSPEKFAGWGFVLDGKLFTRTQLSEEAPMRLASDTIHGTLCALTAAAEMNGFGGAGVAPKCRLFPINCEHQDNYIYICPSKFLDILQRIGSKVDVISNSWDLGPNQSWPLAARQMIDRSTRYGGRRGKGIVFVWSAGNDNRPIDHEASVDVPYAVDPSRGPITVSTRRSFRNPLTKIPDVIHVAAVSSDFRRCHYSNYGPGITLTAPSSNQHTYDPSIQISGKAIVFPELDADFGGTSAAAAMVAGVAALVISANSQLTAQQVVSILKSTADRNLDLSGYERFIPSGETEPADWDVSPIPPFDKGAFQDRGDKDGPWSPWFGYGKVNAARAVEKAREMSVRRHVSQARSASARPYLARAIPTTIVKGAKVMSEFNPQGRDTNEQPPPTREALISCINECNAALGFLSGEARRLRQEIAELSDEEIAEAADLAVELKQTLDAVVKTEEERRDAVRKLAEA